MEKSKGYTDAMEKMVLMTIGAMRAWAPALTQVQRDDMAALLRTCVKGCLELAEEQEEASWEQLVQAAEESRTSERKLFPSVSCQDTDEAVC